MIKSPAAFSLSVHIAIGSEPILRTRTMGQKMVNAFTHNLKPK